MNVLRAPLITMLVLGACALAHAADKDAAKEDPALAAIPLGDVAGADTALASAPPRNPVGLDKQAVSRGEALYRTMNCAGCHGYDGKGAMGPDLTDTYWLYGGTPAMIYKSIAEGRPQGMPSWMHMLPAQSMWDLTAYIASLGGAFPADQHEAAMVGDLSEGVTLGAGEHKTNDTHGRR